MNSHGSRAERASVDEHAVQLAGDTVGRIISDPRCREHAVFRRIEHRFEYE